VNSPAVVPGVTLDYYSSKFCEPCIATRAVLEAAVKLVPAATIAEFDVVAHEARAERDRIRTTPTVVVLDRRGDEVFRAEGVPTLNQVLVAIARAS